MSSIIAFSELKEPIAGVSELLLLALSRDTLFCCLVTAELATAVRRTREDLESKLALNCSMKHNNVMNCDFFLDRNAVKP